MSKQEQTKVIFRKWPNGDIIAFFPELAADMDPYHCLSYEHVGQHGAASICIPNLTPALPQEYAELKQELESIGYKLKVMKKFNYHQVNIRNIQIHREAKA